MSELQRERLAFKNPTNKESVIKELDALIGGWRVWQQEVDKLGDDPQDPFDPRPGRIFADGEDNIKRHRILQATTLEFLEQNITGHGFIRGRDGTHVDRTDLRLKFRVKHRLEELDELRACLEYAGADNTSPEKEEWISAGSALDLLGLKHFTGAQTICTRAHAGLIQSRAERFIHDGKSADDVDIPNEFWWAEGDAALKQNWTTGDFDTWVGRGINEIHLQAFGVTFRRSDIERLRPARPAASTPANALDEGLKMVTAGQKIFIGHGHSLVWLELKNFLQDDLHLTIDEFNRVSTAGVATSNRLKQMLNDAGFAFLILTAEDESIDGQLHARENVVHEAGLFQGKLGFEKAILLLEETCAKFSNIDGLGYISFPTGRIKAAFEDIRRVLKREELIDIKAKR
jgi:predicted nucleotide-binding protein